MQTSFALHRAARQRAYLGLAFAAVLVAPRAEAHLTRVSSSDWKLGSGTATAELQFFRGDFTGLLPPETPEADVEQRVLALISDTSVVRHATSACTLENSTIRPSDNDGWAVHARWTCPGEGPRWSVTLGVLELMPSGHTHLARVNVDGEVVERIARSSTPTFEVAANPSVWAQSWRFLRFGVEHIFKGYDHIAFLLALLLIGGRFRDLVAIVTSFTIAHSVTLAIAALGIFQPPSRWVESLIAASIVAVAAENLWVLRPSQGGGQRATSALHHRWMITFAFGLVHGFGFASALQELALPRSALVAGLVSFNVGVEVGQLTIVALAYPILVWYRTAAGFQIWMRLLSGAIGAFGLFLLVQRLSGG